jgi:hypothetical protein
MAFMLVKEKHMANISINLDSLSPKSFKKTVRHKIKDGTSIFRFLPPFGAESNGYPYCKWNVVWGLTDPSTGRERPFASPSTYEGQCPVFDYLELLRQKVESEKMTLMSKGMSEDQVKTKQEKINKFISGIRPKTVYAYNASDKSGTIGVVELKSTAHKDVLKVMNQYIKDYNQDPTSLNSAVTDSGVWMKIVREGAGFDTKYSASKNQIMLKDATTGVPSYQDDRSALAENISENFQEIGYNLNTLYQKHTYEELKDILIANLINFASDMPEVLVSGYGLEEFEDMPKGSQSAPLAPTRGSGNVAIKLESADEVEDEAPAKPAAKAKASSDTEDLLAMADKMFNS